MPPIAERRDAADITGFSARGVFQAERSPLRLVDDVEALSEPIRLYPDMPDGAPIEELSLVPHEGLAPVETKILPFRERVEQWLERSHDISSPTVLELTNVPLWLREVNDAERVRAEAEGRSFEPRTLGSFSLEELDAKFHNDDEVYLINLYRRDPKALEIAKFYSPEWSQLLNNFDKDKDVRPSGFAVMDYSPDPSIAKDWYEMEEFINKLHELGKKVIVDLVPNHVGLSHRWANPDLEEDFHPEYFMQASPWEVDVLNELHDNPSILEDIRRKPEHERTDHEEYLNWVALSFERVEKTEEDGGMTVYYFAHGRDPYSIPWIDTLQLNYTNLDLQRAMRDEGRKLIEHGVDGFRYDMAHLPTASKMRQTWGADRSFKRKVGDEERTIHMPRLLSDEDLDRLQANAFWAPTIIEFNDYAKEVAYKRALEQGKSEDEAQEIRDKTHLTSIGEAYEGGDKNELGNVDLTTSQWARGVVEVRKAAYERALEDGKSEEEARELSNKVRFLWNKPEIAEDEELSEAEEMSIWASDAVREKLDEVQPREGGFDLLYAKDLLDHMHRIYEGKDHSVNYHTLKDHLRHIISASADGRFNHITFLENHDEERAAAQFGEASKAFVTVLACLREAMPSRDGERGTVFLVHQGQDEGRTIHARMQMARLPSEQPSNSYLKFYNEGKPDILIPGLLPLKGSKLFQEGTCTMLDLDPSNSNPSLFSFKYEADDQSLGKIGAVITINLGNHQAAGRIPGIEKGMETNVVSMTMRREVERPDSERENGMYVELSPYEVQIAYYNPDSKEEEQPVAA